MESTKYAHLRRISKFVNGLAQFCRYGEFYRQRRHFIELDKYGCGTKYGETSLIRNSRYFGLLSFANYDLDDDIAAISDPKLPHVALA
jgi:hypothetical protein